MKIRIKTAYIEWEAEGEPIAYDEGWDRMSESRRKEGFHHQKGVVECHRLFLEFLEKNIKPKRMINPELAYHKLTEEEALELIEKDKAETLADAGT